MPWAGAACAQGAPPSRGARRTLVDAEQDRAVAEDRADLGRLEHVVDGEFGSFDACDPTQADGWATKTCACMGVT